MKEALRKMEGPTPPIKNSASSMCALNNQEHYSLNATYCLEPSEISAAELGEGSHLLCLL